MEDQTHLNEEKYKKNKKALTKVAIIIAILGVLIGGGLIVAGVMKKTNAGNASAIEAPTSSQAESLDDDSVSSDEIYETYENYSQRAQQMQKDFEEEFEESKKANEAQVQQIKQESEAESKRMHDDFVGTTMIMAGIFIAVVSLMAAGAIFKFAYTREIVAFQAQQVMPVAKEGIDQMTPTVAKSVGAIVGEVTKAKNAAAKDTSGETKTERETQETLKN